MIMIEDLWGKTNPFESAISHMLRVGYIFNVGVRKSNLNKVYNQLKESVKIINEVDFLNFISYYLSLHDIGKISPFFQSKDLKMKELLKKENLYVSNISGFRHEYQSEEYIKNIFNKYFDEYIEEEDINSFAAVSALHHYKSGKYEMITNQRKLKIWNDFVDDCEKKIRQVFNFKTVGFSKIIKKDCFFYSLLGLLIICDWLASKENKIDIFCVHHIKQIKRLIGRYF